MSTSALSIELLNPITASCYGDLTFRAYHPLLLGVCAGGPTVAAGASIQGHPIGLALGQAFSTEKPARVLSVYVKAPYRGLNVGTTLLRALEEQFRSMGCHTATLTYASGKPTTAAFEHVLAKRGWSSPEPQKLICRADRSIFAAPWAAKSLPSAFQIFPWVEITKEEREAILEKQAREKWIPDELIPFNYEEGLEPINSLGVRYKGEVVGWVLTQRRDHNVICYCCSFMRTDLQRRGRLIPVYIEASRLQDTLTDKPEAIWVVPYRHKAMAAFVKRRIGPYLTNLAEFRGASKTFSSNVSGLPEMQPRQTENNSAEALQP